MPPTDHLAVWRQVRSVVPWDSVVPWPPTPIAARHDGFAAWAAGRDASLEAAYADVRHTAGVPLTVDLTARWNKTLRNVPVAAFRQGPAYAKAGRERYGLDADTERLFTSCLAEAADTAIPVTARAARAYLDVAFFHPYDDGNARLAALVMAFVLHSEQIELDYVQPLVTTIRRADDATGAAGLAQMVHGTALATARRSRRGEH